MIRALGVLTVVGCGAAGPAPSPPVGNTATSVAATPGATYAPLFRRATLTFPATIVIKRPPRSKSVTTQLTCKLELADPDHSFLDCPSDVRMFEWNFRRDEQGLWLDEVQGDVHLMQAVPDPALLPQQKDVWDIDVRVKAHAGGWCTNYAWAGESTVGQWTLCLRDDQLVGGHYTVERDGGTESVTFGEATR